MKSLIKPKKLTAVLLAFALMVATAFACGFGFTSKSANAASLPDILMAIYHRPEGGDPYDIDDAGPFKQKYDEIDWSNIPLGYRDLVADKYDYVAVTVQFEMWEKNDGNQQIFLYPTKGGEYCDFLQRIEIQYGGNGSANKNKSIVSIHFKSLPLSDFVESNELGLVVRYGATGSFEDTWYNRNCYVYVHVTKRVTREKNTIDYREVYVGFDDRVNNPEDYNK